MKSKDQQLLEETYEQITLRDPRISKERGEKLGEQAKKIKERIKQIENTKSSENYTNDYDPQARLWHDKELKVLHAKLKQVERKYYGE